MRRNRVDGGGMLRPKGGEIDKAGGGGEPLSRKQKSNNASHSPQNNPNKHE